MGSGLSEYERGALILSEPRGRFGYFAAMGKVTRRPGLGPVRKMPHPKRRNQTPKKQNYPLAMASATRIPSTAADTIPPAYPAPVPSGL